MVNYIALEFENISTRFSILFMKLHKLILMFFVLN